MGNVRDKNGIFVCTYSFFVVVEIAIHFDANGKSRFGCVSVGPLLACAMYGGVDAAYMIQTHA